MEKEILSAIETKFAELQAKQLDATSPKIAELKESFADLKGAIEGKAAKEDIEKLSKAFNLLAIDVQKSIEVKKPNAESVVDKFKAELAERADLLKNNNASPQTLKTVGTMTFGNSVTGQIPQADREPGVNDFNKRSFTIESLSNTGTTNSNLMEWVYKAAKEGSAGMTAEGAAKSQLDFTYIVDSASVKKITAFIKISKEMLDDIAGIMSDINGELMYELDYLKETQLISGSGATVYLNGIEKYAQPLDNAGLAGTIPNPDKWAVLGAAITQINVETEGRSAANGALLNPVDIYTMVFGIKSTTNEYIAPLAQVVNDASRILGVPIIPSNSITVGEFLVGDFRKFNIKVKEGVTVAMGYENDDWTKNLVTILAETRLVSYVKKNDEAAFVTDTFADGITFLTQAS